MRNLTVLFVLALLTATVQSQSLTEKEITGTWQVIDVVEAGNEAQQADDMIAAYFDIYPDHRFQLRLKRKDRDSKKYDEIYRNTTWSYNEATQTIELNDGKFPIKVSKSNDKIFFELSGTGIKLEVVLPI